MLIQLSIKEYHQRLNSNAVGPSGGSIAALSGALAAGLILKVCELTEACQGQLKDARQEAESYSKSLLMRVDLDSEILGEVSNALKMPQEPQKAGALREKAMQRIYKSVAGSAAAIARDCAGVLDLAETLLGKCDTNALNELAVASLQAYAGLEGALVILETNSSVWADKHSVALAALEVRTLLRRGLDAKLNILGFVDARRHLHTDVKPLNDQSIH